MSMSMFLEYIPTIDALFVPSHMPNTSLRSHHYYQTVIVHPSIHASIPTNADAAQLRASSPPRNGFLQKPMNQHPLREVESIVYVPMQKANKRPTQIKRQIRWGYHKRLRAKKSSRKDRVVEPSVEESLASIRLHPHSEKEHDENEGNAGISNMFAP
jgi:hypothetical protein